MARSETTFALRFGYARWLKHLVSGEPPGHAEIGRAVGLSGQAVSAWGTRDEPPTNYSYHRPLAEFFGVDEGWLIKNVGQPPRPDLWEAWQKERHRPPLATGFQKKEEAAASRRKGA